MKNVSTNILRDAEKQLSYIPTPNTKEVFQRIFIESKGVKSFNIIGSYGTGKSTFLWACEQTLTQKQNFFDVSDSFSKNKDFRFIKIVGQEESLLRLFALALGLKGRNSASRVIEALNELSQKEPSSRLVIYIDEFGKVLEHLSREELTSEIYFLQQLAEWVNTEDSNAYLLTTLHQGFLNYSRKSNQKDRNEWEKVSGRYIDIVFNEPVEQLLYFASEDLSKIQPSQDHLRGLLEVLELVNQAKLVSYNQILSHSFIERLYPLDWLSANVLVKSLQQYGQNERSLFTFLDDSSSVSIHQKNDRVYGLAEVFDYLVYNLASSLNSIENPHRAQWLVAFRALERAELVFEENYDLASKVIKSIFLANLFSKSGSRLDELFLQSYFQITSNENVLPILDKLKKAGIIRFYSYSNKLGFLEGTDIDIEQEINEARRDLQDKINYVSTLKSLIDLGVEYVKKYSFETGTKRFFEYRIIDELSKIETAKEGVDGYINLVFSKELTAKDLLQKSLETPDNIFIQLENLGRIESLIQRVLLLEQVIDKYADDANATRLLKQEKAHALENLKLETSNYLFEAANNWFVQGKKTSITSARKLSERLTLLCEELYNKTPVFDNELMNRNVLSPPINTAKKALLARLLEEHEEKDLAYDETKFPPDKAIYISLLRETSIHRYDQEKQAYHLCEPLKGTSFYTLFNDCNTFIQEEAKGKLPLSRLYEKLLSPPYKLKRGFIDFWIPVFLIVKKEDFALFYQGQTFIPYLSPETLDLIHKKPEDFQIKIYNTKGVNQGVLEGYKELLGISENRTAQSTFISIYANFLRFIKDLDHYTLNTQKLSKQSILFKEAILKTSDPQTALFDSIPAAFNISSSKGEGEEQMKKLSQEIQKSILELRNAYDQLMDRVQAFLAKSFGQENSSFENLKEQLNSILSSVDEELLIPQQRSFFNRLTSPLDDRKSYLKSVADVALGYPIEQLKDEDERHLKLKMEELAEGLIVASKLNEFNENSSTKKVVQFRLYGLDGEVKKQKVVLNDGIEPSIKERFKTELNELNINSRKQLLVELFSELMTADE